MGYAISNPADVEVVEPTRIGYQLLHIRRADFPAEIARKNFPSHVRPENRIRPALDEHGKVFHCLPKPFWAIGRIAHHCEHFGADTDLFAQVAASFYILHVILSFVLLRPDFFGWSIHSKNQAPQPASVYDLRKVSPLPTRCKKRALDRMEKTCYNEYRKANSFPFRDKKQK